MASNTSPWSSAQAARKRVTFPVLVPEIQNPPDHGAAIWVFELPEKRAATSAK